MYTQPDEKFNVTVSSLLTLASKAYQEFESHDFVKDSSKVERKRKLLSFVLSNLELKGEKLLYSYKKPFDELAKVESHAFCRGSWTLLKPRSVFLVRMCYIKNIMIKIYK